ncbi:MAG: glutathione S-transferase family protein [Kordiimonas sp.]
MTELQIIVGNKRYSSWSLRGWLAAIHTGLNVDEVNIDLYTATHADEIAQYSPVKLVPILKHGPATIWDSAAIIDYCAHIAPEKYWWPTDIEAYAFARSIFNEMHSGFTEMRTHMPMNVAGKWSDLTLSEALQREITRAETIWTECREQYGQGGEFLFGSFSAADMMYAPLASRMETYGIKLNETATVYVQSIMNYPPIAKWVQAGLQETARISAAEIESEATFLG